MEEKRFYLSNNRKIAGVCAGISEYFAIDVVFVRVLSLAGFLSGFLSVATFILYIAFWLVVPMKKI